MFGTATSNLQLPDGPEWTAKMGVVNLLKNSPLLKGKLPTFLCYDGHVDDDSDPDSLPKPFVRLRVKPGPSNWFAAGQHKFPVEFQFELAVEGTSERPLLALWHAIRLSLSPLRAAPGDGSKTVLDVLQATGLSTWEFNEAAYAVENAGKGQNRYLYGVGYCTGWLLINT